MNKVYDITATCSGKVIKLEEINDEVFSTGMLGSGFAIIPDGKDFISPVDGKISNAHDEGHAYIISARNGVELLIHIGIDTVELEGEYFSPVVKAGMSVMQGDKIVYADVEKIASRGYDPVTTVVITNPEIVDKFKITYGQVKAGDTVMEYNLK